MEVDGCSTKNRVQKIFRLPPVNIRLTVVSNILVNNIEQLA